MSSRLFSRDPAAGVTRLFHYDESSDRVTIETQHRVDDIVTANQHERNLLDERARWGDAFGHKVASIPMNVYWDLKRKGIADDPAKLKKWLNDPDNRAFRSRVGRV
jgi:hypothetical protein